MSMFESAMLLQGIEHLQKQILAINRSNGWNVPTPDTWDDPNPYRVPAILALLHSEVSEALEAYRKKDKANFTDELADVFIRLMELTGGLEIDIIRAVWAKLEKNRHRDFKHGGKLL